MSHLEVSDSTHKTSSVFHTSYRAWGLLSFDNSLSWFVDTKKMLHTWFQFYDT